MATDSILITCLPDGTYHVKTTEPKGEMGSMDHEPYDKSVGNADEVMQLVQEWLADEEAEEESMEGPEEGAMEGMGDEEPAPTDAKAAKASAAKKAQSMWDEEAAKRQDSNY